MEKNAPWWLTHKPVVTVDYEEKDAYAGDAKFLSIGHATWNSEDYSAKVWRWSEDGERWSRQGEELPLWRVLDLATLLVAVINGKQSNLKEFVQDHESIEGLNEFIKDNMELFSPRVAELKKMLETKDLIETEDSVPNIFSFATSELSQDAMFAWLIKWADIKYKATDPAIHDVAQDFVRLLIGNGNCEIQSVEVGRQWNNIDVWVKINDDTFLAIEDKKDTSIHGNQLERYKAFVEEEYAGKRDKLYFAYVKTGNEPLNIIKAIESKGYCSISRNEIIQCLSKYNGSNALITNFTEHLIGIERETQSFMELPVSKWGWYAWQGFYKALEKELEISSWDYVANPSGGFLGAWWHFEKIENGEMYLQFEYQKLCFKISCDDKDNRSAIRDEQYNKLIALVRQQGMDEIQRPARFGAGTWMTIAVVDPDYIFGKGKIDMKEIVSKLKKYQCLVDLCCKS